MERKLQPCFMSLWLYGLVTGAALDASWRVIRLHVNAGRQVSQDRAPTTQQDVVAKYEDEDIGCLGDSDSDFCHFLDCLLFWCQQLHQEVNTSQYIGGMPLQLTGCTACAEQRLQRTTVQCPLASPYFCIFVFKDALLGVALCI